MSEGWIEKRRFQRILYQTPATLFTQDGQEISCEVIDLSLRGCLLRLPECFDPGKQHCTLQIPLARGALIEMHVSPVHQQDRQQGFACVKIDLPSLSLLKRLIELNLGDVQLLERELSALVP